MGKLTAKEIFETVKINSWSVPKTAKELGINLIELNLHIPMKMKRQIYYNLLESTNWDVVKAAEIDGIAANGFLHKMSRYGIQTRKSSRTAKVNLRKGVVNKALEEHGWKIYTTAKALNIAPYTIYRYLGKEGLVTVRQKRKTVKKAGVRKRWSDRPGEIKRRQEKLDERQEKNEAIRRKVIEVLKKYDLNLKKATKELNISGQTIYRILGARSVRDARRKVFGGAVRQLVAVEPLRQIFPKKIIYIPEFRRNMDLGFRDSRVISSLAKLKADVALGVPTQRLAYHTLRRYVAKERAFRERTGLPPIPEIPNDVFESAIQMRKIELLQKKHPLLDVRKVNLASMHKRMRHK